MHSKKIQQAQTPLLFLITKEQIMWIRTRMASVTTELRQNPRRLLPVEIIPIKIRTESVITGKHPITLKMLKVKTMLTKTMMVFAITGRAIILDMAVEKGMDTETENAMGMDANIVTDGKVTIKINENEKHKRTNSEL
jgi:hypothetical protein